MIFKELLLWHSLFSVRLFVVFRTSSLLSTNFRHLTNDSVLMTAVRREPFSVAPQPGHAEAGAPVVGLSLTPIACGRENEMETKK